MILQALTQLYTDLVDRGEIPRQGWGPAKISYALCLDEAGQVTQVIPLLVETQSGKKTVLRPRMMTLPAAVVRPNTIKPNFLWDNSGYLLGADGKGNSKRSQECFLASGAFHHQILDGVDSPAAKAVLAYFDTWQPELAETHPALAGCWAELMKGSNLVFRVAGQFVQDDPKIQAAWEAHYHQTEGPVAQCLVTGRQEVTEAVHPSIKGVRGAQPSGAAIVSFNAPAFCSYRKEKSYNAPVGKSAAFAYTAALNHLLADKDNVHQIGDATVVCWAEGADPAYNAFSNVFLFGDKPTGEITDDELRSTVDRLAKGLPCAEKNLDPKRPFYLLGLSPNAARVSIRFFYRSTFGEVMRNVNEHHNRMNIVGSQFQFIPLWAMLRETVNLNAKDKAPSPVMAGAVARAIFTGTAYPASLLEAAMLRIRSERNITPGRAAILKAYYLKNASTQCPEEVLTVSLNESSTNIPYTLGRLFSVYEAVQESANPGINATIRDKYFNSAASTPGMIFPILDNLCKKHLRKLETGSRIYFEKQIGELKNRLGESYPTRLTLPEQGSFDLGYYHQKQSRYTKKEEENNGSN